jgi:plastocyanin
MRVSALVLVGLLGARPSAGAAEPNARWLGDDLPLPMPVKTPQDIGFKAAAERQYLIFNLMAGGKLAFQRGDYATAVDKWESLLRMPGLDPQIQAAVAPFLVEAQSKVSPGEPHAEIKPEPAAGETAAGKPGTAARSPGGGSGSSRTVAHHFVPGVSVSGTVVGGGQIGPGGAVVWLKRLDGPAPHIQPPTNQIVTQREKTFLPHVLAVPLGTSVQFRNDDRIYHNVFSIAKPNDFDAGIRASGSTYTRTFNNPGAVQLLCNIHSTMNAYVFVVDSPFYAKAQASGAFVIHNVPPGKYELSAWHEAASQITRKTIVVGPEGHHDLNLTVGGDKRPGPFVPDKYGHKRQPQLGY